MIIAIHVVGGCIPWVCYGRPVWSLHPAKDGQPDAACNVDGGGDSNRNGDLDQLRALSSRAEPPTGALRLQLSGVLKGLHQSAAMEVL